MNDDIFFPDTSIDNTIVSSLSLLSYFCNPKEIIAIIIIAILYSQPSIAQQITFEETNSPVIVLTENGDMTTVSENNGLRMWNRIEELARLKAGWDGAGSEPIKKEIICFLQGLISECDDNLLKNWVLFPDSRGYLYLDYANKKDMAGITITDDAFVYFIKKDGALEKKDDNVLTQEALTNILRKVNG